MPRCQLCNRHFAVITNTHLRSSHRATIQVYTARFGHKGVGFSRTIAQLAKDDPRYVLWRASLLLRPPPWNKGYTKETHSSVAKISNTFRERKIDNFARWRKIHAGGRALRRYPPLEKKAELAFLIGLTLGDGSLGRVSRTESLRITLGTDKPSLVEYAAGIIREVFHKEPYIRKRKNSACVDVGLYQNDLGRRLGIPLGSKRKLMIVLPRWISKKQEFVTAWLKGLFEAEASLSIHKPTYTYNFSFSNRNPSLLRNVRECLARLGFHPEVRSNAIRLRRKEEVEKFRKLIKFREYGYYG